jgi:hypothetical protein
MEIRLTTVSETMPFVFRHDPEWDRSVGNSVSGTFGKRESILRGKRDI